VFRQVAFPVTIIGQAFGAAAEEYKIQKRKERMQREQRMKQREAKRSEALAAMPSLAQAQAANVITNAGEGVAYRCYNVASFPLQGAHVHLRGPVRLFLGSL
jgi:hypothetical protein